MILVKKIVSDRRLSKQRSLKWPVYYDFCETFLYGGSSTPLLSTHHGHDGVDCLGGGVLPAGPRHDARAEVGHVEGDALQHAVRALAALLLQLYNTNIFYIVYKYFYRIGC